MTWPLVIGAGWLLLAVLVAVVIGRSVRLADARAVAEANGEEPNFVVDPMTSPRGLPAGTVLPFRTLSGLDSDDHAAARPVVGDTPTIPGIPVARPQAPGTRNGGNNGDVIRRTRMG